MSSLWFSKWCHVWPTSLVGGQQKYISWTLRSWTKKFTPDAPIWGIFETNLLQIVLVEDAKQSTVGCISQLEKSWWSRSLETPHSSVLWLNLEPRSTRTILLWFLEVQTGTICKLRRFSNVWKHLFEWRELWSLLTWRWNCFCCQFANRFSCCLGWWRKTSFVLTPGFLLLLRAPCDRNLLISWNYRIHDRLLHCILKINILFVSNK